MKKKALLLLGLLIYTVSYTQEIGIELLEDGFDNPVGIEHTNDQRLFIVEKGGVIKIIENQSTLSIPFLDIDDRVSNSGGERGLLGLAFHPNYNANGFFFVNYINNSGNTVISRFTTNPPDSNTADPSSEVVFLTINQPYGNHNGGDLAFGEDGYLYIATGDGGSGGDPENRSQNLNSLLGKLLRININNSGTTTVYAIPDDNPFISNANARDEIWAYGLRNPWRFSFDKTNDKLWIADVGQNEIEEINQVNASEGGINYGWRCYEGNDTYNTSGCPSMSSLQFPVSQYTHTTSGEFKCSITGGYNYQGTTYPNLVGTYFFADYCSDEIGTLTYNGTTWDMAFTERYIGKGWTSFGEDNNGELYIAAADTGEIYHLVDTSLSVPEFSTNTIKLYPNPVNNRVTINALSSPTAIQAITLYDVRGNTLKSIHKLNSKKIEINVQDLSLGIYFMEIQGINGSKTLKKLIVN